MSALITGSVQLKGLKELDEALAQLGAVVGRRVLRSAMIKSLEPMVEAARRNALAIAKSGALALAMGSKFYVEQGGIPPIGMRLQDVVSAAVVSVGPLRGDRPARAAYTVYYRRGAGFGGLATSIRHGHLIEYGTRRSRALPFLRPAFDATHQQVIATFTEELRTRILKVRARMYR